jgi:hypothetical protein
MGLLKKEAKRAFQAIGIDNRLTWYQDDNSIVLPVELLSNMADGFMNIGLCPDSSISRLQTFRDAFLDFGTIPMEKAVKEIILINIPNLIEYFLVYIDLPETVEGLVISKIKEFKRQQGVILDKINQKRKKLL